MLAVLLLFCSPARDLFAVENGLALIQAIREGRLHSPQAESASAAYEEARWRRMEAFGAGFLPKISASGAHYFDKKFVFTDLDFGGAPASIPGIYPTSSLAFDASLPLFDGFASLARLQAASLAQAAAENELDRAQFQVEQDIRLAFYQALAAHQLANVAEQNVLTLEDHLRQTAALKKGGAATNYDVLRVEVQLNEARSDAVDAKDNVELARKRLTRLLGLESDDRALAGELPIPRGELVRALALDEKTRNRSDLKALQLRAEAAERLESAQARWLVPSVSLVGEYLFYNNRTTSIRDAERYRSAYNFGIQARWNLFDGGVALSRSRESVHQAIQAESASRKAALELPLDFETWKRRYLSNAARFETKKLDLDRSQESVRLVREEFRAGTRTSTEVLDAELDLFRARAGVVSAQSNAAEALIKLELALGRRL